MLVNGLARLGVSPWYWLVLLLLGLSLEGVALYYQYGLDYWPCVLCIHVRIWVLGLILVALAGLFLRQSRTWCSLAHIAVLAVGIGLLERAWNLLGVERGTLEGSCDFDAGLPGWFALDEWFPALFKVWESCGYTPELLLGVTMAEALMVLAALLVAVGAALAGATAIAGYRGRFRPEV